MPESAKDAILARIRAAQPSPPSEQNGTMDVVIAERGGALPTYQPTDDRPRAQLIAELIDRLRDYKATVERIAADSLPATIAAACEQYAIQRLVIPVDIPSNWLPAQVEALRDDPPLTNADLDSSDGALTGCAYAVAQTGTIALDGGPLQGRRALTLIPDRHICIVHADQVVGSVPNVVTRLGSQPIRPITFISGPSATSDIELSRVEGVHGPRTLHILLVDDEGNPQ